MPPQHCTLNLKWISATARAIANRQGVSFKTCLVEAEKGDAGTILRDLERGTAALVDQAEAALMAELRSIPFPPRHGRCPDAVILHERSLCVQVAVRVAASGAMARFQQDHHTIIPFEGSIEEEGQGEEQRLSTSVHNVLVRGFFSAFEAFAELHAMPREHYPPRVGTNTSGTVGWDTIVLLYFVHHIPQLARLAGGAVVDSSMGPMVRSWRKLLVALQTVDPHEAPEHSRRRGALSLVNGLLIILFHRYNTQQCAVLVRSVEHAEAVSANAHDAAKSILAPSLHMTAEVVTYYYFKGRMELYQRSFPAAFESLRRAYRLLPPLAQGTEAQSRNKSRVRFYLAIAGLLSGHAVLPEVLKADPQLAEVLNPLQDAIELGSPVLYSRALERSAGVLRRRGVYLLLAHGSLLCYLVLFARVHAAMDKLPGVDKSRVTLATLSAALDATVAASGGGGKERKDDPAVSRNDACALWVTRLISLGYVKGYLSYEHSTVVLSKVDPFPLLNSSLPS